MENTIVTMTDAAFNHIQKQISHSPDKKYFRLGVKRTGCSGWMYTSIQSTFRF
jgi:Fe-S cluster assembly iron-binding protein IscA